jgi:PIN domain nuclease of toxin-antitoxin system
VKVLLDTCTFLWWLTSPTEVPSRTLEVLRATQNDVFLSAATGWEIAIKRKLGRLSLPFGTTEFLSEAAARHEIAILDVTLAHAVGAGELPLHHKDPFDRLLIAQARIEKLVVATPDPAFRRYGVKTLWRRMPAGSASK